MMDDLISRRDAINAVSEITTTMSVCTNKDECYGMKRMQKQAITELANLPSAEPYTTTHDSIPAETGKNDGDGTSGDCISRTRSVDALRDYLVEKRCPDDGTLTCRLIENEVINKLPSVQPERPTGEWIQKPRYEDDEYPDVQPNLKCPFCGYEIGWYDMGNYCARCGADLKGGAE